MGDRELTDDKLPEWLEADLARAYRDGVFFKRGKDRGTISIHWHPGDRNVLAEKIIEKVGEEPMLLELDGYKYMIHKLP